jgi:hypothetical protein
MKLLWDLITGVGVGVSSYIQMRRLYGSCFSAFTRVVKPFPNECAFYLAICLNLHQLLLYIIIYHLNSLLANGFAIWMGKVSMLEGIYEWGVLFSIPSCTTVHNFNLSYPDQIHTHFPTIIQSKCTVLCDICKLWTLLPPISVNNTMIRIVDSVSRVNYMWGWLGFITTSMRYIDHICICLTLYHSYIVDWCQVCTRHSFYVQHALKFVTQVQKGIIRINFKSIFQNRPGDI